jgi:ketosteroid isomerase-like protein
MPKRLHPWAMNNASTVATLESAVLQAVMDRRWDALSDLLDEDFVITTAGWLAEPAGKAEWVREAEARHELHDFSIESLVERSFADTRVVLVLSTQTLTWQGERQDLRFRYTDVWRRAQDRWLLAVRHASMVPAAR